jgi:broad specificity phosphatase PhoE
MPTATAALRPWNVGLFAGQPTAVVHPRLVLYQQNGLRVPFGEPWQDFVDRFTGFLRKLTNDCVLVTHFRNVAFLIGAEKAASTGRVAHVSFDPQTLECKCLS